MQFFMSLASLMIAVGAITLDVPSGTPPAPIAAKASYHASLASSPVIPFHDTADASSGALTWHYSIPSTLKPFVRNIQFTNATTTSPPHATCLAFDLTAQVMPGEYTLSATVTSATKGLTSSAGSVILTVDGLVEAWYFSNPYGFYVTDASGKVIPKGNTPLTTSVVHPQQAADFGPRRSNVNLTSPGHSTEQTRSNDVACGSYSASSNPASR